MFCPKCGKPVDDGDVFCKSCGANLGRGQESAAPASTSTVPDGGFENHDYNQNNYENYQPADQFNAVDLDPNGMADPQRDPKFKSLLIGSWICGGIGMIMGGLAALGSIMLRFGEGIYEGDGTFSDRGFAFLMLLIIGGMIGAVAVALGFGFGKKAFGESKAKGFVENFPGVLLALGLCGVVIALAFQGFYLIIS